MTPKQKEKTQERSTTSSNLNLSNEIERNSPETTRPTESLIRPESYRGKEENDSAVKYEQPIPQNHAKTKTIDDSSGVEPMLSNRNQNASQSFQNKLTENQNKLLEIQNQIETNNALLASNISNQNPVPESNKTEAKIERFNTDEAQSEPIEEKKEVSPFRVPPIGGGVRPPFKPNMNTKMPMPNIRKPGPIVGGNPFNKPVATKPNAQGEGA